MRLSKLHILLALWLIFAFAQSGALAQQSLHLVGFEYQISQDPHWGSGHPLITQVYPYSDAYQAGVRPQDLLLEVDGISTKGLSNAQVRQLLQTPQQKHLLRLWSVGRGKIQLLTKGQRISPASLSERELAVRFGLYSLEDTGEMNLRYPFVYSRGKEELSRYHTFSFASNRGELSNTDLEVNQEIRRQLLARGLKEQSEGADLVISIYYNLSENKGERQPTELAPLNYRWTPKSESFGLYPIYPMGTPAQAGAFTLSLGVQFLANHPSKPQLLWGVESTEVLSEPISVEEYAKLSIPLMLHPYPRVIATSQSIYQLRSLRYNYTGIHLSEQDLHRVTDVDDNSPAFASGIRPGDYINSINGIPLGEHPLETAEEHYLSFLADSEYLRDTSLPLMSTESELKAFRYWRTDRYANIAKLLERSGYTNPWAYLFSFRPYINAGEHQEVIFSITRGQETYAIGVRPELSSESSIRLH